MVDIDHAGEIGEFTTALRREIDSNCLVPVWQLRGPAHAIPYVVDGGGSALQAGQTGYDDIMRSRSVARFADGTRPRKPEG